MKKTLPVDFLTTLVTADHVESHGDHWACMMCGRAATGPQAIARTCSSLHFAKFTPPYHPVFDFRIDSSSLFPLGSLFAHKERLDQLRAED